VNLGCTCILSDKDSRNITSVQHVSEMFDIPSLTKQFKEALNLRSVKQRNLCRCEPDYLGLEIWVIDHATVLSRQHDIVICLFWCHVLISEAGPSIFLRFPLHFGVLLKAKALWIVWNYFKILIAMTLETFSRLQNSLKDRWDM